MSVSIDANKVIKALHEIAKAVHSRKSLKPLYRLIHQNLGQIINADNFFIALHDETKDTISFVYWVDEKDDMREPIQNFSQTPSLTGKVIVEQKALLMLKKDILEYADKQGQEPCGTPPEIWLGAPLVIENRVRGVVAVQSYQSADIYTAEDINLLDSVAQYISFAIERKESEDRFRQQEQILEKIFEMSPVGIGLLENRVFKWVNNEMLRIFGYSSKEEVEDRSARIIYKSKRDFDNAGRIIVHDLKEYGKSDFEFDLVKKDGSVFSANINVTSSDTDTPLKSTIVLITDISKEKQALDEKYEKERLHGVLEMAGAVCHEINQPLQAISGYAELLLLSSKPDDLQRDKLISIQAQTLRLGDIIKKLSSITKYSTKDYPGDTKIIDIWKASLDNKSKGKD